MTRKDKDCGTCPECKVWSYWFLNAGTCTWCGFIVGMKNHKFVELVEERKNVG